MAVIQVAFRHGNATQENLSGNSRHAEAFSSQIRRLVVAEASEWRTEEDIVIDWGDPAQTLDAPTLALACKNGQAMPLFGRSWVHYHRPTQQLTLGVDQLGLFPILLVEHKNVTYIASDTLALSQLLGATAEPDPRALLELLAYGQLLGTQSSLRGAQHLEAATVCSINRQGLRHTFVDAPLALPELAVSEEDALDALVAAVDRRFRRDPDTLIVLSGGVGSRLLLAAALACGHRPATFSFSCPGTHHYQIAEELAAVAGTQFFDNDTHPRQFANARSSVAQLGGGEVPLHEAHALLCPELIARTRGTTLLTGLGGEAYRGLYYDRGMPGSEMLGYAGLKSPLLKTARRYAAEAFSPSLSAFSEAFPDFRDEFTQRLQIRLDIYQAGARNAAHYLDSVYLGEQMRRREVAAQQLLARDYARSHPFVDADVLHTLGNLPVAQRLGSRFLRNAVTRLNPKLAEVRWEKTLRPLNHGLRWEERYSALAGYLGMVSQPLPEQKVCLSEMTDWLLQLSENNEVLHQALREYGLTDAAILRGVPLLLHAQTTASLRNLGTLGSFSTWAAYLTNQRAALAA